jgi:hypothetical protein
MSLHIEIADDDAAFAVVKLKRGTLHPGVLTALMAEVNITPLDYTRGQKNGSQSQPLPTASLLHAAAWT